MIKSKRNEVENCRKEKSETGWSNPYKHLNDNSDKKYLYDIVEASVIRR